MKISTRTKTLTILGLLFLLAGSTEVKATEGVSSTGRYALVIGNSHYDGDDVSGIKDAEQMTEYLKDDLGFTIVDEIKDGDLTRMQKGLDRLSASIGQASVVVFFYSGHGFQNGTENFLMPIHGSADPQNALPLNAVKDALTAAPRAVKLVFLDACRDNKFLRDDQPKGLKAERTPASRDTLYAFAAGPGQTTPARTAKDFSAYSTALLHYIRDPGLKITELLDNVRHDLTGIGQLPQFVINGVPSDFYLREPVYLRPKVEEANDQLLVLLNGEIVLNSNDNTEQPLRLKAGRNDLRLVVAKSKSYHNNHDWDTPEGWSYSLKLGFRGEGEIFCSGPNQNGYCFQGREDTQFKDGPHHGKAFVVAQATLVVDGGTEPPRVTLEDSDTDIWNHKAPIWARDQDRLYGQSISSLNLRPEDILDVLALQPPWNVLLRPLVQQILTSGTLLGHKIADPNQTFVTVWGNRVLQSSVQACMTQHRDERLSDMKKGIAAVFSRVPRPFEIFDRGLIDCVRDAEQKNGSPLQPNDILIWTAIQEGSRVSQGTPVSLPADSLAATKSAPMASRHSRSLP
ncbi:MAG: caspase domain-containing protein [Thermoanaerobaculia bacterium]